LLRQLLEQRAAPLGHDQPRLFSRVAISRCATWGPTNITSLTTSRFGGGRRARTNGYTSRGASTGTSRSGIPNKAATLADRRARGSSVCGPVMRPAGTPGSDETSPNGSIIGGIAIGRSRRAATRSLRRTTCTRWRARQQHGHRQVVTNIGCPTACPGSTRRLVLMQGGVIVANYHRCDPLPRCSLGCLHSGCVLPGGIQGPQCCELGLAGHLAWLGRRARAPLCPGQQETLSVLHGAHPPGRQDLPLLPFESP